MKYIVIIKNGSVRQPKDEKELKWLQENQQDAEKVLNKMGIDVYIAQNEKDNKDFMSMTTDETKAQVFASDVQAKAIVDYLVEVNRLNDKKFDIVIGTIEYKIKEVK